MFSIRTIVILTASFMLLMSLNTVALADDPVGTIHFSSKSVAIGIGVSWGDGTFKYKGQEHKFSISGMSALDLGISSISAKGQVYHLNKPSDLTGTYFSAEAGFALGGGAAGLTMKNQNGVVIQVQATQKGLKLTLAAEGVSIKLK